MLTIGWLQVPTSEVGSTANRLWSNLDCKYICISNVAMHDSFQTDSLANTTKDLISSDTQVEGTVDSPQ